jgi:hypothetical protein
VKLVYNPLTGRFDADNASSGVLPPSSGTTTDDAIARWDGTTGERLANSGVTLSDANRITIPSGSTAGIAFGDGDTSLYEVSDDTLVFKTNGIEAVEISNTQAVYLANPLTVPSGGTGTNSLTAGYSLIGNGGNAVQLINASAKGSMVVGNGTTTPTALTVGTNNYVLTADSAQTAGVKWAAASGGSLEFIVTSAASNSASIEFTSTHITSTYNNYVIVLRSIVAGTNLAVPWLRISTDGGSTWKSGAGNYLWATTGLSSSAGSLNGASAGDTEYQIIGTQQLGTDAGEMLNAWIVMYDPLNTSSKTCFQTSTSYLNVSSALMQQDSCGNYNTVGATNGVQLLMSSGNIASGQVTLYGVKES